jgi:hypothetical protein
MKTEYTKRPISWVICRSGTPIFDESCTQITIIDECGGEFLEVEQEDGKILLQDDEWPMIREMIDEAFSEIKRHEAERKQTENAGDR